MTIQRKDLSGIRIFVDIMMIDPTAMFGMIKKENSGNTGLRVFHQTIKILGGWYINQMDGGLRENMGTGLSFLKNMIEADYGILSRKNNRI